MNLDLKKKVVKCTIWSVVLYGAETWTMIQADKARLEHERVSEQFLNGTSAQYSVT